MKVYLIFKRIFDTLLAVVALLILWPLFLAISVIIKVESPGPVFFKQKRIGRNKKEFHIIKFRTMRTDTPRDMPTHMLKNAESYITKTGGFLRKTSLDELPQLLNILRGEMSVVGPRPALWNQYDLIEERDKYGANKLTPGLTGWAQVNGRDELSTVDKARYDGYYAEHVSLPLDLKIFFMTVSGVVTSKGVKEGAQDNGDNNSNGDNQGQISKKEKEV